MEIISYWVSHDAACWASSSRRHVVATADRTGNGAKRDRRPQMKYHYRQFNSPPRFFFLYNFCGLERAVDALTRAASSSNSTHPTPSRRSMSIHPRHLAHTPLRINRDLMWTFYFQWEDKRRSFFKQGGKNEGINVEERREILISRLIYKYQ